MSLVRTTTREKVEEAAPVADDVRDGFSYGSVRAIVGDVKEVMLYGFHTIIYSSTGKSLPSYLREKFKVYNFHDEINALPFRIPRSKDSTEQLCKVTLTNLILHNYMQSESGLPMVPLIFCIGMEGTYSHPIDFRKIGLSDSTHRSITESELRRAYKLFSDPDLPPKIKMIAAQTFKFVSLKVDGEGRPNRIEQITPFWEHPEFKMAWQIRKNMPKKAAAAKSYPWRKEILSRVQLFNQIRQDEQDLGEAVAASRTAEKKLTPNK